MDANDLKGRKLPGERPAPTKRYARRLRDATRDAMLTVKLSSAELATLKATATERHGWLVSEYIRNLVNADQVGAVDWKEADVRIQRTTMGAARIRLRKAGE